MSIQKYHNLTFCNTSSLNNPNPNSESRKFAEKRQYPLKATVCINFISYIPHDYDENSAIRKAMAFRHFVEHSSGRNSKSHPENSTMVTQLKNRNLRQGTLATKMTSALVNTKMLKHTCMSSSNTPRPDKALTLLVANKAHFAVELYQIVIQPSLQVL